MKIIRLSFLLMLILTLTLVITSCGASFPREVINQIDNLEDRIENEHDQAPSNNPDRLRYDGASRENAQTEPPAQEAPVQETPAQDSPSQEIPTQEAPKDRHDRKTDKKKPVGEVVLTFEDAEGIALEHAGVTPSDALYMRTELELDDGIPVYEVEFHVDLADRVEHLEYEYTIHADTGVILEFEMDYD